MNAKRFLEIKQKYKALEKKKIENEAGKKSILKRLKEEFDLNNIEEAEVFVSSLKEKIENDEKRRDFLMQKIEDAIDWDEINV